MEIHEAVPFQSFSRVYKFRLQFLAEWVPDAATWISDYFPG